ncbi:glutathione S-transferase [Jannaschia seohaensis]|uniref:Glutathione S-transferase n=1 Tax=Jannaschia seohaensis TaxID=475081 RepID=A0A2Y9AXW2_9RHOB|nr:glutathione S-transferase [Jannaschia seohaensis]PWJ16159.1 glutathione S-transferase [Jannaschia seohaensis]SSA49154.1 glutathione S-transferase [Jannaschia seohaensis]
MTYDLLIGDCAYSSWSLRGWLLFDAFGLPVRARHTRMYSDEFARDLAAWAPARTVPTVRTPEGGLWTDSLAIAEGLAEAHPEAGHWPADPVARAAARSLVAEMHSGFTALRGACPMNLRVKSGGFTPSDAVLTDLARIETLWSHARTLASDGPWLFGAYGAADAFYAPVAMRIAGYGLPVSPDAQRYVDAHLSHGALRRWRAMGEAQDRTLDVYEVHAPTERFPMPAPLPARARPDGPSVNAACPYSGKAVTHFLEFEDRIWGFCNAFCRDKTVADPGAWPAFTAMAARA